ncbi:cytoplasmic dynein 2 heavy chain 1-like protein [Leptotrombidium deliense]|uniref:Cytoplasmic dynein 2 heavy chain 1-like protein n=1 Tax=Leptotrombidium deliense TaxID=299467 RepID=A0A443SW97_9ACAR|nr:cytoplasmic dynein 2 heavy chain 1-like protein [Leptotrombidium deliense]
MEYLMWNRVCHIYRVSFWNETSQRQIAKMITTTNEEDNFFNLFPKIFNLCDTFTNDSRRFLAFIDTFNRLHSEKKLNLQEKSSHLVNGVSKLEQASSEVEKLKEEAKQQQTILAAKRQEADDALTLITSSMQNSEEQKVELEDIKARTEKETAKLKVRKTEIDAELKEIEPTLLAAKAAVGGIKPESLSEIRSLRAPPEVIRDILEGVLRLMGVNDTSWVSMKSFLSRRGVREEIMNFDARKITPEMRTKVEALMKSKGESFEEQQAKRASAAAAPLAIWLKANVTYSKVLHKIKPLEDEQNKLESGLRSAMNRMKSLTGELQGVEVEVGNLRNKLNQVTVEAAEIEVNLKQTNRMLQRSESLISELSSEFTRWKQQLNDLNKELKALPLQCLVAAAYLTLVGIECSSEKRLKLLEKFSEKAGLKEFDLLRFLNCDKEEDVFICTQSSLLTTVVIDPSRKFISSLSNVDIVDLNKQDWQRTLELCLRFGRTVIVDGFAKMNLQLLSLMRHEIYGTEGSRQWIILGDKRVDYNSNFRLFLLATDTFSELYSNTLLNVVNLAPSNSNTAAMLLSITIKIRRPELEQKKADLERSCRDMESKLKSLEEELLHKLSSSTGNILNNDQLIQSLKDIKKSTNEIESSLKQAAAIANDLNKERVQYEQLAQFASNVYFEIRELYHLNHMYRIGIQEYVELFIECLKSNSDLTNDRLLQDVYNEASRGLFPQDKIILKRFLDSRHSTKLMTNELSLSSFLQSQFSNNKNRVSLIVTSMGSDPSAEIVEIFSSLNLKEYCLMSMGSDYIAKAETALEDNKSKFVCLTNLHFVVGWLPKLSSILMRLNDNKQNKCIVLVSECHDEFPTSLLEMSTKFVYESVPGLKAQVNSLNIDSSLKAIQEFNRIAYFHAVCIERRQYVPFGWTKNYDFGFNDFKSALNLIEEVKKSVNRKWQLNFIRGLLQNVIYGGKLDTISDAIIMESLVKQWFNNLESNVEFDLRSKSEISILGLPSNINIWKNSLLEENLANGVQILERAANIKTHREELQLLKQKWRNTNLRPTHEVKTSKYSPVVQFFVSECNKVNSLISLIENDLNNSNNETLNCLSNNETPDTWLTLFPTGPQKVDKFIEKFSKTANELRRRENSTDFNFNVTNLLSVRSLMNALRQQASRDMSVDIQSLKIYFFWGKQCTQFNQSFMVTLTGFVIEGALFDDCLIECSPNSELQSSMPTLYIYFVDKVSKLCISLIHTYTVLPY